MTLFEYITQNPVIFAKWFLRDKEASCIDPDEQLYVGMETAVMLFKCDENGYPIEDGDDSVHELEGSQVTPELAAELEAALLLTLNVEVDENGNPLDI